MSKDDSLEIYVNHFRITFVSYDFTMIYSIDTSLFLRDILTDVSERDDEGTLVSYVKYTIAILSFDASKSYRANQSDE